MDPTIRADLKALHRYKTSTAFSPHGKVEQQLASSKSSENVIKTPPSKQERKNEIKITPNGVDFKSMSMQHGYVHARQKLRQAAITNHQKHVQQVEGEHNASKLPLRIKEAVHLGTTFGSVPKDTVLDRIMSGNSGMYMSLSSQYDILQNVLQVDKSSKPSTVKSVSTATIMPSKSTATTSVIDQLQHEGRAIYTADSTDGLNVGSSGDLVSSTSIASAYVADSASNTRTLRQPRSHAELLARYYPESNAMDQFIEDDALRHAFESVQSEILIPNRDVFTVPVGLGDTLNLQLAFTRRMVCSRNLIRTLISDRIPQLSIYHMRYLRDLNLSFNKVGVLPADFGLLRQLETLDLSHNLLSKLPSSVKEMKLLKKVVLSDNNFSSLPDEFGLLDALEYLDLSSNLFTRFPYVAVRLRTLKTLLFDKNNLIHLAVLPPQLRPSDLWTKVIDNWTGEWIHMNVLTHERLKKIEHYNGAGIKRAKWLHSFQQDGSLHYRKRKVWLSVCQIPEWEPATDAESGLLYYRNNVSGDTSWSMPSSLDTLGRLSVLEEFYIRRNSIKTLPLSFININTVRKIVMTRNRLNMLPDEIGSMQNLQHLELTSNELKILPVSLCKCSSLETLLLNDNNLLRLPEGLGYLPNLKRLDVSTNRLQTFPFSMGYCASLQILQVQENPLIDPPIDEFSKGVDSIRWYCRNRFLIEKQGKPPLIEFHTIGIANEVSVLKPEFTAIVQQMIEASQRDGLLNLQLLGLKEIPPDVLKMKHLKRLKLDFNDSLNMGNGFPLQFSSLHMLSICTCRMSVLPENVFIFEKLTTLHLHENRFESIPEGINEIRTLTYLDLSKNRIFDLPFGFEKLHRLKTLNLESNNLEFIPELLCKMTGLRTLNLAKNRLNDFPDSMCDLTELKVLNLEKNRLQFLPMRLGKMSMVELRVGHNLIEVLDADLFAFELGHAVKIFSCCENNLMELPWSIVKIDPEAFLEADFNPYISPPPYLLSEGLRVVQNYLLIRRTRKQHFEELMADEDFEIAPNSFEPFASEVLTYGTGFLSPDDLADFDQAVDEFLNGEYFRCPSTAQEIVDTITTLRDRRETELYLTILYTFLDVLKNIFVSKDERYSNACVIEATRPWGRKGEECNVWVVSLLSLLRDVSPNIYVPNGRPSIFSLVHEALPSIPFPFTVDLLKDALRLYESPYGKVGDTEQIDFPNCDCVDETRNGKPRRHDPCTKASVVVVKSVYVEEESVRREIEEDEYLAIFEEIEDDVRIWLMTEEGKNLQDKEIRRRKAVLKEEIMLREEMTTSQQVKMKKVANTIVSVTKRKEQYEAGEPFENHGFRDVSDAIKMLTTAQEDLDKLTGRVELLKEAIAKLKEELGQKYDVWMRITGDDLVQKYCVQHYNKSVKKFRLFALKHGLRRYWDGADGEAYAHWKKNNDYWGATDGVGDEIPPDDGDRPGTSNKGRKNGIRRAASDSSIATDDSGGRDREPDPEYDFQHTADAGKLYELYVYSRYKRERARNSFF